MESPRGTKLDWWNSIDGHLGALKIRPIKPLLLREVIHNCGRVCPYVSFGGRHADVGIDHLLAFCVETDKTIARLEAKR